MTHKPGEDIQADSAAKQGLAPPPVLTELRPVFLLDFFGSPNWFRFQLSFAGRLLIPTLGLQLSPQLIFLLTTYPYLTPRRGEGLCFPP